MITNRQFISDITNDIKALSMDDFVSPKFIFNKGVGIVEDFIKKDENFQLINLTEGWKEATCLRMEEVPVTQCDLDMMICEKLMRSRCRIPDIYSMKNRKLIRSVSSVDFSNFYEPTTPKGWRNIQNRRDKSDKKYFFWIDGYIYIPVAKKDSMSSPEQIRIEAYFQKPWEVDIMGDCSCNKNSDCVKPLDYNFICPNYLLNDVKQETVKQISQVYLKIQSDANPNLNQIDKNQQ